MGSVLFMLLSAAQNAFVMYSNFIIVESHIKQFDDLSLSYYNAFMLMTVAVVG